MAWRSQLTCARSARLGRLDTSLRHSSGYTLRRGADLKALERLVKPGYERQVGAWLVGSAGLIFTMIGIGGYTRLSGSGLSMTDWRIEGRALPRSDERWLEEFEEYKKYPEYQRLHAGMMELEEFKRIYFVEWFHRMWGRSAGVLFAGPLAYFAARRIITPRLTLRLVGLLGLGISQAFVGWWMVRSGLEAPEKHTPTLGENQRPRVSPYRLASHWTAALTIYGTCLWTGLTMLRPLKSDLHRSAKQILAAGKLSRALHPAAAVVLLTLVSGPFVAGNDAGRAYNTWPKMLEHWVPPEWVHAAQAPLVRWRAFFEETGVVQFDHRCLAYASIATSYGAWFYSRSLALSPAGRTVARLLPVAVTFQMLLGITTLLQHVTTELGVAHQAGGVAVLSVLLFVLHTLRLPVIL